MTPRSTRPPNSGFLGLLLGIAWACGFGAAPLGAATEEFSTFDVVAMEEDDESVLDHLLTAPPSVWRDEWERAPLAMRIGQGCFTSGQWIIDSELKLATAIGRRASLAVVDRRYESDDASFHHTDFWVRFATRRGTFGAYFRPFHDKSRQDFGFAWETGNDTLGLQTQALFTVEDTFNNLWEFRQSRVGNASQPYLRHPYEPALRIAWRDPRWRAELAGKWLTPSRRQVSDLLPGPDPQPTLWGAHGEAALEADAFALRWSVAGAVRQAASRADFSVPAAVAGDHWRRLWRAELGVATRAIPRTRAELRGIYVARTQHSHPALADYRFDAIDRVLWLDAWTTLTPSLWLRLGAMHDRVSIARAAALPFFTYGSRTESRAYFGLGARFGRLTVTAVEGIELDREPYDVWWVHDKGFLAAQVTF